MKKVVLAAALACATSISFAGGEVPAAPIAPPPPVYYAPQPVVAPEAPGYFTRVGNDGLDTVYSGGDFIKQTVDFVVGTVTLGYVDIAKDDIR